LFKTINKIFTSLLTILILILLNMVVGNWAAALLTAASWVSIGFGLLLALFLLWVDVQIIVLSALRIKNQFSSKSINLNVKSQSKE